MTYRVMIVEDEPPSMRDIEKKIATCGIPGITVAAKAINGQQALELIPKVRPHIIFSDVRMPVMDGFQLVERVRAEYPDILIAILSGYQEFDYVKKALHFKLTDYLLKPLDADELKTVLKRMVESIDRAFDHSIWQYLQSCANSRSLPGTCPVALENRSVFSINAGLYYDDPTIPMPSLFLDRSRFQEILDNLPERPRFWVLECTSPNRLLAVSKEAWQPDWTAIFHSLCRSLGPLPLTMAYRRIGNAETLSRDMANVQHRIQQAVIPEKSQLLNAEEDFAIQIPPPISPSDEKNLLSLLESRKPERFSSTLTFLLEKRIPRDATQQYMQRVFDDIIALIKGHLSELSGSSVFLLESIPGEVFALNAPHGSIEEFSSRIHLFLKTCNYSGGSTETVVAKIASYLRNNFSEPIELQSLATKFGVSPTYLSTLFKKHYGMSPIKYLLQVRIDKAKSLIEADPDITFREVALLVGYEDSHYFSRIFRGVTGLAPSEYRKSVISTSRPAQS